MNATTLDLIRTAQSATGADITGYNASFLAKLIELTAGRCADIADENDIYQTYNVGGEICEEFGLTAE